MKAIHRPPLPELPLSQAAAGMSEGDKTEEDCGLLRRGRRLSRGKKERFEEDMWQQCMSRYSTPLSSLNSWCMSEKTH